MTKFLDIFPDDEIIQSVGDEVTYIPLIGLSRIITAIVDDGNQNTIAVDSYVPEKHIYIEFLKNDAPAVAKGDQFVYEGKILTVDTVLNDDGNIIRVVVH